MENFSLKEVKPLLLQLLKLIVVVALAWLWVVLSATPIYN